jgi:glutamate 5-kinase
MRLVVKIGTSTIAHSSGRLNIRHVEKLCKVISDLKNGGQEVVIVSSGAIGMGVGKLGLCSRPNDMPTKQAAAAVGQCELMYTYDKLFSEYNHTVAQILITGEDVENESRLSHFKDTVFRLLQLGAIPIINENDTVSTAEIAVGDNDTLAAIVGVNVNADLVVLLSDIDGLYTADPKQDKGAKLIENIEKIDDGIERLAKGAGSDLGTGGMITKLNAAKICVKNGIDMIIANGSQPENLYKIVEGEKVGTRFKGKV